MKAGFVSVVCLLLLTIVIAQERVQAATSTPNPTVLESKVRKAWEDFKNKDKESFAATLADGFSEAEEDGSGFGDKKAILTMIDQFELGAYSLKDFKVRTIGKDAALITYRAHYEGKVGGQPIQANTAYGEIWVNQGHNWKLLYVQETNVK